VQYEPNTVINSIHSVFFNKSNTNTCVIQIKNQTNRRETKKNQGAKTMPPPSLVNIKPVVLIIVMLFALYTLAKIFCPEIFEGL